MRICTTFLFLKSCVYSHSYVSNPSPKHVCKTSKLKKILSLGCPFSDRLPAAFFSKNRATASRSDIPTCHRPHHPPSAFLPPILATLSPKPYPRNILRLPATIIPLVPRPDLHPPLEALLALRTTALHRNTAPRLNRWHSSSTRWEVRRHPACRCAYKLRKDHRRSVRIDMHVLPTQRIGHFTAG